MAFSFDQIFAADPSNPSNVAQNASITIFAPGDTGMTPLTITDPDGQPLSNPIPVNANGFGSAFAHATLDRVAWAGGGFTGFFTSYEGMKQVALDAQAAAEAAAATAGAEATVVANAAVATVIADAEAAATSASTAASNASASAAAAETAAALVNAPADTAIATVINGTTTATKAALNATFSRRITSGGWELKNPWPAVHPTPPVVTHATARTGTGSSQVIPSVDPRIRRYGDYGAFTSNDGGKNAISSTIAGYEFYVQGSTYVEITWYESVANAHRVWIWLDDQPLTAAPAATITTGTGTRVFTHIALPNTGRHKIAFYAGELGGIGTVYTSVAATVSPTPPRLRLGWVGDSYSDGTSHSHEAMSHPFTVARMLNMELAPDAVGSTGYITGTQFWNSAVRLDRMARSNPDVIVFDGSVNDPNTMTVAQVTAVYDSYAAQHPGVPFIVFGPQASSATNTITQSRADVNKTVRDAALAHPSVIAYHDVIGTADGIVPAAWNSATTTYAKGAKVTYLGAVWAATSTKGLVTAAPGTSYDWELLSDGYYGTGLVGSPASNGTRDIVLASDGVHPTEAGSNMLANNRALAILNTLRGL